MLCAPASHHMFKELSSPELHGRISTMHPRRCIENVRAEQWASVTHAVCAAPTGKKYKLSRSKGIPCVTTQWLSACLQHGYLVPPDGFLVPTDPSATQGGGTQGTRVPACLEATQAGLLPQSVSQGVSIVATRAFQFGCNHCTLLKRSATVQRAGALGCKQHVATSAHRLHVAATLRPGAPSDDSCVFVYAGGVLSRTQLQGRQALIARQLSNDSRSRSTSRPGGALSVGSDGGAPSWSAAARLPDNKDNSILRQLSQNLSVVQADDNSGAGAILRRHLCSKRITEHYAVQCIR